MKKEYNKLVRDLIPSIINDSGKVCTFDVLSDEDYITALMQKLNEEVAEYHESQDYEEVAEYHESQDYEELVDILEVVYAIAGATGCSERDLNALRKSKAEMCGRFAQKILLKDVEETPDYSFLLKMKEYLEGQGVLYSTTFPEQIVLRQKGKNFPFEEHLKGFIYSQLSAQVPWHRIVPHLREIDELFSNYNVSEIFAHSPEYYITGIKERKCGSRCTNRQMNHLHNNIRILQQIVADHGSLDHYINSKDPESIVRDLSSGCYKLFGIGPALAWEYLRNVGVDGTKPDVHVCRFLGKDRLGLSSHAIATQREATAIVKSISQELKISMVEIDSIIWSFCATGYGSICSANPKCDECVIEKYCAHQKTSTLV